MGAVAGGALLAGRLLAAQRRLIGVELRIYLLYVLSNDADIGGYFGFVAVVAQHRLQDVVHALGQQAFHAAAVIELLAGHGQFGVFRLIR